jgi:hypothetical protein
MNLDTIIYRQQVITTTPNSRHERLYGWWISFAEKQQEQVLTFNILAQVLVDYQF